MSSSPPPPPGGAVVRYTQPLPATWYRCHPRVYGPTAFNPSDAGNARFSPLRAPGGGVVPTLYVAETLEAALMEVVLRDVPVPSGGYVLSKAHMLSRDLAVTPVVVTPPAVTTLWLADLTSLGLRRLGAPRIDSTEVTAYGQSRAWGEWIYAHQADAAGLLWMSRQLNERRVAVLFEGRDAQVAAAGPSRALDDAGVWAALVRLLLHLGVGLAP